MSALAFAYDKEANAVNEACSAALDVLQKFSTSSQEHDNDDDDVAWKNPNEMLEQIDLARTNILEACEQLKAATAAAKEEEKVAKHNNDEDEEQQKEADILRATYMDMITDAFGDTLEEMRNNSNGGDNNIDVDILIDCLQSGIDLMSAKDKEFFIMSSSQQQESSTTGDSGSEERCQNEESSSSNSSNNRMMTPHEIRRRELGFHVERTPAWKIKNGNCLTFFVHRKLIIIFVSSIY